MAELGPEHYVGVVRDYFRKIGVAAVEVTAGTIRVGDAVRFRGAHTDLAQRIDRMEVNHQSVLEARAGELVAIRVADRVREHDKVFKEGGEVREEL